MDQIQHLTYMLSFFETESRNYNHLLFLAREYKSHQHQPIYETKHKLHDKKWGSRLASFYGALSLISLSNILEMLPKCSEILTSSSILGHGPKCLKLSSGSLPLMVPNAKIWMLCNKWWVKYLHKSKKSNGTVKVSYILTSCPHPGSWNLISEVTHSQS